MAAFPQRIQNFNGFSLRLAGGQNKPGVRPPAVITNRVNGHGAATTDSVRNCCGRLRSPRSRGAEQEWSGPPGPGQGRDGPRVSMRSYHDGRTGGPSSGRVLAAVAVHTPNKPNFVMLRVGTAGPGNRRRMRSRYGGNGGRGERSSTPLLISGHMTMNFVLGQNQEQTGTDKTERRAATPGAGEAEGEDDREAEARRWRPAEGSHRAPRSEWGG